MFGFVVVGYFLAPKKVGEITWVIIATEQPVEKKLLVPQASWHKEGTHSSVPSALVG